MTAAGMGPLEEAARSARGQGGDERDNALGGWGAYLVESNAARAAELWQAAGDDVWGVYGRVEAARRRLDTRARLTEALRLCEVAPRHPLCAVGARIARSLVGESPGLDRRIEEAALAALERGVAGDAAWVLRTAAAAARAHRGDEAGSRALLAEAGVIDSALLLGPYSRFHVLELDTAFDPERGQLGGKGPLGAIVPRNASAPDGHFAIHAEPTSADVYYLAADVEAEDSGRYLLRVGARISYKAFVDGALALERREFERYRPEEQLVQLALGDGRHRILVKLSRGNDRGDVWLALARADGKPARLKFVPATGPAPEARAPQLEAPTAAWPEAASLVAALEPEVGRALASYVAARDANERDEEGARALTQALVALKASAPLLVARGESALADHSIPSRVGKGQAHRDFEEALRLDPGEASVLQRLSVDARGESRYDEAADLLERALRVAAPGSWRLALSEMRLAQARGSDAAADDAAQRALALEPGLCDALELRYDLARRMDAAALLDQLVAGLALCPGGVRQQVEHLRLRGDLDGARTLAERHARQEPLDPARWQSLAGLWLAADRPQEAAAVYAQLERAWPYDPHFHKRRAEALQRAGDERGARAEREAALALDGSDLKLRRALSVADGKELLDDMRQDGLAYLGEYRNAAPAERSAGAYILDSTAVEAYADGSSTERTHVLAKVVDQRGVSELAEVNLPAGAEVLTLRTLKKDGRVLEPESIGGKEGVSLPGVEVGDFVEYEYLSATSARGAAAPGWTAPKFYFRIADAVLFRSILEVRAPVGSGLEVQGRNLDPEDGAAPAPAAEGGYERVRVERRNMPAYLREPGGPSSDEVLPHVQAGWGAGNEQMLEGIADSIVERSVATAEVARFAREAAEGKQGLAAVQAVYARVMQQVKGQESALTVSAAATLAQGRGSRLMLLKAALGELGLGSRVVVVRPFSVDPGPRRFPAPELWAHALLRVEVEGRALLLDPSVRFAPFGQLPAQVQGQPAFALPGPGQKLEALTVPGNRESDLKQVQLDLALGADGTLAGTGREIFPGLEGAYLRVSLERLDEDQRRQAVEAAVARSFQNAVLKSFAIKGEDAAGEPVVIEYQFTAPGFARVDGDRIVVPRGIYEANLGRRFLALSQRATPLLVGNPERLELLAQVKPPEGMALAGPPSNAKAQTPFGAYERAEKIEGGRVQLNERISIPLQRVSPEQYAGFGEFVSAVDRSQAREWVFQKTGEAPKVPVEAPK